MNIIGLYTIRYSGISQAIVVSSGVLVLAISVLAMIISARKASAIGLASIIAVALWAVGVAANELNNVQTGGLDYISIFATGFALVAVAVIRPGRDATLGPAVYGVTVGIVGALVAVINPDSAFQECRTDKCGPLGTLFLGSFGNENAYGLAMALALPFVLLSFRGRPRWVLASYVLLMVWVSGSRSSLIAALAVVAVAFVCNPRIDVESVRGRFWPIAMLTGIVAALCGIILPFLTVERGAFSYRGLVWETAIRHFSDAPILGAGANGWKRLVAQGEVSSAQAYSAHSLWLDILFTTGIAGILLLMALLAVIIATTPRWLLILPVIAVITAGISERPWTLTAANWLVWTLPALLVLRREGRVHALPACAGATARTIPSWRNHREE